MRMTAFALVCCASVAFSLPLQAFEIQHGVRWLRDKQTVTFDKNFQGTPVVVVSAQQKGSAIAASATNVSKRQFEVLLRDKDGKPASGWVHWTAVIPDASKSVLGDASSLANNAKVTFPALPIAPVVIVNAQGGGTVYRAAAKNTSKTGFTVVLTDHDGKSPKAPITVQWIAVAPGRNNLFQGQAVQSGNGTTIALQTKMQQPPTIVISALAASKGVAAAASQYGDADFVMALFDENGAPSTTASTQWLAYGDKAIVSGASGGTSRPGAAAGGPGSHTCMYCGDWVSKVANGTATKLPTWNEESDSSELCDADAAVILGVFVDCACEACSAQCQGAANFCSGLTDDATAACWQCVSISALGGACQNQFNACAADDD